jgi:hypothetical protein
MIILQLVKPVRRAASKARSDPVRRAAKRGGRLKGEIWVAEDFDAPDFEIANPCNSGEP